MRATILVGSHLKRGEVGDVEVLPEGVKFKLPGTMKKKFLNVSNYADGCGMV
jgi:hypothetical protein